MSETISNSSGVGFCGLLTVLFIGLKLTGHIEWSWWWVFAPLWGPLAVLCAIVGVVVVAVASVTAIEKRRKK